MEAEALEGSGDEAEEELKSVHVRLAAWKEGGREGKGC